MPRIAGKRQKIGRMNFPSYAGFVQLGWEEHQLSRWLPFAVMAVVVCIVAQLPPTNDAAWQLWIGRRLAGGAELYRDIVEINPPLWFWLTVPIVKVSDFLGVSGFTGLVTFLGISSALSLALVQRLEANLWIALGLIFAFFATGLAATGQREQFTLIAVTPYVFLAAARAERRTVPVWLAVLVGVWAALGIALKHYFALVPVALELWLLFKRRGSLWPELMALGVVGAVYIAAIVAITPEYLRSIVPMIRETYGAYDLDLGWLLSSDVLSIGFIALVGLGLVRRRTATTEALAVAGVVFLFVFLLQQKNFRYHGLPAIGMFSLMAIVAITEQRTTDFRSKAATFVLGLAVLLAAVTSFNQRLRPSQPALSLLCDLPRGSTALALTPYGDVAWPAIEICGLKWASRYMFLWMLPEINREPDRHAVLAETVRRAIVDDTERYRPDLILIEKGPNSLNADPFEFMMSDPAFRSQLARYDEGTSIGGLAIFRKKAVASTSTRPK